MKRTILSILLIVLLSFPAIISFFQPGFMVTDDGGWMVIRLAAFYDAIRDGQFPVRWVDTLNFGYGYPVTNFLYPAYLYLGVPLVILTSQFVLTIKLLFIASIIAGPIGMFLWLSQKFSRFISIIAALIFAYIPYHLFNVTSRGSLGETLFLSVVPFLFWSIDTKRKFLMSILVATLLLSHNTLALLFMPVIILYCIVIRGDLRSKRKEFLIPFMLGGGASLFFWIPALFELNSTRFFQVSISDYSEYFSDISLLGVVPIIILLGSIIVFLKNKKRKVVSIEGLFLISGILSVFMASSLSQIFWRILPVSLIQFPFRFLSLSVVVVAYLFAQLLSEIRFGKVLAIVSLVVLVALSRDYIFPRSYSDALDESYSTNQATTTIKNEYMPKDVTVDPFQRAESSGMLKNGIVTQLVRSSNKYDVSVVAKEASLLSIEQLYFPGWTVEVDNKPVAIGVEKGSGRMQVQMPSGEHTASFRFGETPLRLLANLISLFSVMLMVWIYGVKRYAKN